MNTIKIIFSITIFLFAGVSHAQETGIKENIDGSYHMAFPEKDIENRVMQLVNSNGSEMLAMADCEQCFPAFLVYDKEGTKSLGKPVFTFRGFYLITYDDESFVSVRLSLKDGENFSSINFYSKNKIKAQSMTKKQIEDYALSY